MFENARVPHANLVGEVNGAAKARGGALQFGAVELAANALGVCEAAVEMAMEHARTRLQGGKYLGEHQAIQLKLSEMHMLTDALRSFVLFFRLTGATFRASILPVGRWLAAPTRRSRDAQRIRQ